MRSTIVAARVGTVGLSSVSPEASFSLDSCVDIVLMGLEGGAPTRLAGGGIVSSRLVSS